MYGPLSTLPSYHLLPNALSDSSQLRSPDKLMSAKPGERKALCITSQVHLMAQEAESVRGGFKETKPLDENVKIKRKENEWCYWKVTEGMYLEAWGIGVTSVEATNPIKQEAQFCQGLPCADDRAGSKGVKSPDENVKSHRNEQKEEMWMLRNKCITAWYKENWRYHVKVTEQMHLGAWSEVCSRNSQVLQ